MIVIDSIKDMLLKGWFSRETAFDLDQKRDAATPEVIQDFLLGRGPDPLVYWRQQFIWGATRAIQELARRVTALEAAAAPGEKP